MKKNKLAFIIDQINTIKTENTSLSKHLIENV